MGRLCTFCTVVLIVHAYAWKSPPDPNACASWCVYKPEENCVQPYKRDQCRGCDKCREIRARETAQTSGGSCAKLVYLQISRSVNLRPY